MLLHSEQIKLLCKVSLAIIYLLGLDLELVHRTYAQDSPDDYVNEHNAARAIMRVDPLTWNETLAAYAQNYVRLRTNDCDLVHSEGPYGENLVWSSGNLSGRDAVKLWVAEGPDYGFISNNCEAGKVCGHYTQVIWQSSHFLGCAKSLCNNGGTFISCNYDPPGNLVGERPLSGSIINKSSPPPEEIAPIYPSVPPFNYHSRTNKKIKALVVGLTAAASAMFVGLCFIYLVLKWKRKQNENNPVFDVSFVDEFENGLGPRKFSYTDLASATNNFGEEAKLGEGGFGEVYRGFLKDLNMFVAVKKVSRTSKQGSKEYATEVKIISRLRHRNTVKLIGWCHQKELILVYEFMPNGSLDSHLFRGKSLLTGELRYKIVQDLASALLYLHEEGDHCVLHRDIKSSNIMLDADFNAKLGDFGLARLVDHAKGSQTTVLAGTMGYMAPECFIASKASKESDIFSFGVVALEIACGRRSIEPRYEEYQVSLVPWVWELYGNKKLEDVIDKKLSMNFDMKQMECQIVVGLWCAHPDHNLRPSIRQVIQVLKFELPLPNLPCKMPVPKYDAHIASLVSSGGPSDLSLTVPR